MPIDIEVLNAWFAQSVWPFFRVTGLLMTVPILGAQNVPMQVKIALSLFLTFILAPLVSHGSLPDLFSWWGYWLVIREMLVGIAIGLMVQLFFQIFIMSGQVVAMQMGLGFASLNDPQNNADVPVISQFYLILVTLLFLVVDGHLWVIRILAESFKTIPLEGFGLDGLDIWQLVLWGKSIFEGGLLLVLPVMFATLAVNLIFGIMARAAPQLTIFAIGFPLTLCFGITLVVLMIPTILPHFYSFFDELVKVMRLLINGG